MCTFQTPPPCLPFPAQVARQDGGNLAARLDDMSSGQRPGAQARGGGQR